MKRSARTSNDTTGQRKKCVDLGLTNLAATVDSGSAISVRRTLPSGKTAATPPTSMVHMIAAERIVVIMMLLVGSLDQLNVVCEGASIESRKAKMMNKWYRLYYSSYAFSKKASFPVF